MNAPRDLPGRLAASHGDRAQALGELDGVLDGAPRADRRGIEALEASQTVYLLAPSSFLGDTFAATVAQRLVQAGKSVCFVDDVLAARGERWHDAPLTDCAGFVARARSQRAVVAINLSMSPFASGRFELAARQAGVTHVDLVPVLDFLDLPVIYQTAAQMRAATLARADDYRRLARRLDDPLSVRTLAAVIALRLTLDRRVMLPVLCSLEDEYFSTCPVGKDVSFALRGDEILCDVGAYKGTTVQRFLAATRWSYRAIHSFEPDAQNFAAMRQGLFADLPDFHPRHAAVSDTHSVLRFAQTGTMGSRVDEGGGVEVEAVRLDDELDAVTFIKMDVEGHETRVIEGARRLIGQDRPRLAVTGYHYADDLLDIVARLDTIEPDYRLRLRHHSFYYFDTILYADMA